MADKPEPTPAKPAPKKGVPRGPLKHNPRRDNWTDKDAQDYQNRKGMPE
jgi:hypothetical protein